MPFKVMYTNHGPVQRGGQGTGDPGADKQRARQPRPSCVGHEIDIRQRDARFRKNQTREWHNTADVVTRGEFRHDTPVGLMHVDLTV